MIEFGNLLNYTAMGLGNHDFDDSIAGIKPFAERTTFDLLASNIQNNLSELWSVFDFVQPKIFGPFVPFQNKYAEVIQKGLLKDASSAEKSKAHALSK